MSVVIKGFNKPEDCYSCPFNRSDCYCGLTEGAIFYTQDRDDWGCSIDCPIKELPKRHGRLKDVSKIDDDRIESYNPVICLTMNGQYIEAVSLDYINSLPTIIEAESEEDNADSN